MEYFVKFMTDWTPTIRKRKLQGSELIQIPKVGGPQIRSANCKSTYWRT